MLFDYIRSGWSFFFRWPVSNAQTFRVLGIFLGPFLQMSVYFFFAGIALALLNSKFAYLAPFVGWVGLSMLTGFFHEDGLADTADSLGVSKYDSSASLERIHSTFKDPRLGTFGVSALVLFWLFRYVSATEFGSEIFIFALACLFSRTCSLGLGLLFYSKVSQLRSSRVSHVMQDASPFAGALMLLFGVVLGIGILFALRSLLGPFAGSFETVSFWSFTESLVGSVCLTLFMSGFILFGLIRRTEALNGDLLGATVCISEVIITICIFIVF